MKNLGTRVVIIDLVSSSEGTGMFDQFANVRARVKSEMIEAGKLKPISFEIYKKTPQERVDIANAKRQYKENMYKG